LLDSFLFQSMLASLPATYDCIKAFAQTDFTEDLKRFDVPTLIMHGDDDETTYDNFAGDFGERFVPGYKRPSTVDFLMKAPFEE